MTHYYTSNADLKFVSNGLKSHNFDRCEIVFIVYSEDLLSKGMKQR